jgi:hypothetical protein
MRQGVATSSLSGGPAPEPRNTKGQECPAGGPSPYHPAMPSLSRRGWALLGVFTLVPILNFPRALFADRALFIRDIGMVWAPQSEAVVQQVARGDFPFFDAHRAFGQPLFADPRAEVLYPPAWIHLLLPPDKSYAWFAAFHLVIAALGAARLARSLWPEASPGALATAGLAYGASGPLLSLVAHWHHLAAAAWMPWIVALAGRRPGRTVPWLGLAGLVTLQVLAGSPDYTFTTFALCLLCLLSRKDVPARDRLHTLSALLLGLSLAAVQLLPSLSFATEAAREDLPVGWALSPLHPSAAVETLLPVRVETWPLLPAAREMLFGGGQVWMFSHYLGFSVWILASVGLARACREDRRFLGGAVLLGLILALGVKSEWLQRLIAHVPLIRGLRFPTKHLAASSLGLAILASRGVEAPWPDRLPHRVGAVAFASVLYCMILFAWSTGPGAAFDARALIEPTIALVAVVVLLLTLKRGSRAAVLLPAVVAFDLLGAHAGLNPTTPSAAFSDRPPLTLSIPRGSRLYVSDYSIQARTGSIRMPAEPPYRLASAPAGFTEAETLALAADWYLNPPTAGRWGYFGSFDLDILDFYRRPLKRTIESFVTTRDPEIVLQNLRRAAVDYVVTMDPKDLWEALPLVTEERRFFADPVRVYRVPGSWPRARFETEEGALAPGTPRILSFTDGRIEVEATCSRPTKLVLAFANDPGWRVTVDGQDADARDNDMAFLSVSLGPGAHRVDFVYAAPMLASGAAISLASLVALFLISARAKRMSAVRIESGTPIAAE